LQVNAESSLSVAEISEPSGCRVWEAGSSGVVLQDHPIKPTLPSALKTFATKHLDKK
jgi:hypothetical protein